jgi:hypothetical protein
LFGAELQRDLEADTQALRELVASFGEWRTETDSKLAALLVLLREVHTDEKVLIFTEYKDSAEYIARSITDAGISSVGLATGDSENPTRLAHRFSPRSNALPGQEVPAFEGELRVLVATDVLSEGQNLQDAHIVVNYDLPWAIIRLIQRAGRVDRIGQQADKVFLYSFFHESVNNVIDLRRRVSLRLSANAEAFGSDELFFGSADEVKIITDLYNGTLDEQEIEEEVDASSIAYQRWKLAEDQTPEFAARVAALPDMIDATRGHRLTDDDEAVVVYVRTEAGVDGFGCATGSGAVRLLTGHEVLRMFEATPEERGHAHRPDHDDLLRELVRGPLAAPTTTAGRLRGVRRTVWARLGETLHAFEPATQSALDELFQHPLTSEAEQRLRRAIRAGASDADLATRVAALHRDDRLVVTTRTGTDPVRIVSSMGILP